MRAILAGRVINLVCDDDDDEKSDSEKKSDKELDTKLDNELDDDEDDEKGNWIHRSFNVVSTTFGTSNGYNIVLL